MFVFIIIFVDNVVNMPNFNAQEQAKIAKLGLEMKLITSEMDAETEKWDNQSDNEIVRRAKNMSSMAFSMYLFTRGEGPLKTTQVWYHPGGKRLVRVNCTSCSHAINCQVLDRKVCNSSLKKIVLTKQRFIADRVDLISQKLDTILAQNVDLK